MTGGQAGVLHCAENEDKTVSGPERTMFVTGVNRNQDAAFQEMQAVKERFGKTGGNVTYHAYQSFKPGEVTPELRHKLGMKPCTSVYPPTMRKRAYQAVSKIKRAFVKGNFTEKVKFSPR